MSVVVYYFYEMWQSLMSADRDKVPYDIAVLPVLCF